MCMCVCECVCECVCVKETLKERENEREGGRERGCVCVYTGYVYGHDQSAPLRTGVRCTMGGGKESATSRT